MKSTIVVTATLLACMLTGTLGQQESGSCITANEQGQFRPDPNNDCSAFYKCENNAWLLFRCVPGLVFNSQTQICDFPKDYSTCSTPTQPAFLLTPISQASSCRMPCYPNYDAVYPKLTANSIDCQRYYMCEGGRLYEGGCASVGSGFVYYDTFSRACSKRLDPWNFNCNPGTLAGKKRRRRRRR